MNKMRDAYQVVGWKEFVCLTKFKLHNVRAKIDSGAKTSALHADNIEYIIIKGEKYVRFLYTDDDGIKHLLKSPHIEDRIIKSSNGEKTLRPVIKTNLQIGMKIFEIEITLINRDMMGFKMLIGREALKAGKFLINPAKQNLIKTASATVKGKKG